MILLLIAIAVAVLLAVLMKSKGKKAASGGASRSGWIIGPIIKGRNYSVGMPARPTIQGAGWTFAFPGPSCKVDYVQNFSQPNLAGAKSLTMRFSVTGGGFKAFEDAAPARVGLHIQRRGDDWSAQGAYQQYRWYSRERLELKAGEYTLTVPLSLGSWSDVYGQSDNPDAFAAALADMECIAVVFGGIGAGHGVYAVEPSRFTLIDIRGN